MRRIKQIHPTNKKLGEKKGCLESMGVPFPSSLLKYPRIPLINSLFPLAGLTWFMSLEAKNVALSQVSVQGPSCPIHCSFLNDRFLAPFMFSQAPNVSSSFVCLIAYFASSFELAKVIPNLMTTRIL